MESVLWCAHETGSVRYRWSRPAVFVGPPLLKQIPLASGTANLVANLIRFLFRPAQTGNDSSRIPAAARQADRFQTYVPQIDRSLIPLKSFVVIVVAIVG